MLVQACRDTGFESIPRRLNFDAVDYDRYVIKNGENDEWTSVAFPSLGPQNSVGREIIW